jgi:hypothetical protein
VTGGGTSRGEPLITHILSDGSELLNVPRPEHPTSVDSAHAGAGRAGLTVDKVRQHWQADVERRQTDARIRAGIAVVTLLAAVAAVWYTLAHRDNHPACTAPPTPATIGRDGAGGSAG